MPILLRKAKVALCLLPLVATLGGAPRESPRPALRIRVAQESAPGAGDFDDHILGFIEALQTEGTAAAFYRMDYARYGNTTPVLTPNKGHVFFVNGSDGVALFVVFGSPNQNNVNNTGTAQTRWELSGGTASLLQSDDYGEAWASDGGTVFTTNMSWLGANTDGMVVGNLPVGFTILGQFTAMPTDDEADGMTGWLVISADGTAYPLSFVAGQRVRLDVKLVTDVQQGKP